MTYLLPLLAAVALNTADRTLTRASLRRHDLADEFLLVYQLTSTVLTAPFAVLALARGGIRGTVPGGTLLLLLAGSVVCWTVYSVYAFRSAARLELSVASTISRLRLVLVAVLGVLFFGETISGTHAIGLAVLLAAYIPLTRLPGTRVDRLGVVYCLLSTVGITGALLFDKALARGLDPAVIVFVGFAGTLVTGFRLNRGLSWRAARPVLGPAAVAGAAGAAGYYALVAALATGPAVVVLPVYQASAFLYVLVGVVFLAESADWRRKVLSAGLSLAGALLVLHG